MCLFFILCCQFNVFKMHTFKIVCMLNECIETHGTQHRMSFSDGAVLTLLCVFAVCSFWLLLLLLVFACTTCVFLQKISYMHTTYVRSAFFVFHFFLGYTLPNISSIKYRLCCLSIHITHGIYIYIYRLDMRCIHAIEWRDANRV